MSKSHYHNNLRMDYDHQIWYVGTSHEKPAWDCMWTTMTHFQGQRSQFCEFHHNYVIMSAVRVSVSLSIRPSPVTAITCKGNELE